MADFQEQYDPSPAEQDFAPVDPPSYYRIRFREQGQEFTADTELHDLEHGRTVIVKTEHGNEPAIVVGKAAGLVNKALGRPVSYSISRHASVDEAEEYEQLAYLEKDAFVFCQKQVAALDLPMQLVRVERFFNGSKIIFYFTAENRVDFRELVKVLVQEYRTRVEMRQIGVRHETQMIGGLGSCGRELCCSSFLKKFEYVSIKMAKTQDLPLNPAKTSGVCQSVPLCCLTYQYDTYRSMKRGMPRAGRSIRFDGELYKIIRQIPLSGSLLALNTKGEERLFEEEEWRAAELVQKPSPRKVQGKKGGASSSRPEKKEE